MINKKIKNLSDVPLPDPVPNKKTYDDEILKSINFSEKRKKNYSIYKKSKKNNAIINFFPVKLDIENVSRCNFKCKMCVVSDWDKGRRSKDMSLDQFKKIIDEQYGLTEIKLQGLGEPLLQKDIYFEMIKYARSKRIWVRTTTNASLLHLNNNYKKLIDSGVNEIQISVDGATKEIFQDIRRGSVFEKVVQNCKLINSYAKKMNKDRTKMWTVVQNKNFHQLHKLVSLASDLGFSNQVFSLDLTNWGSKKWDETNSKKKVDNKINLDLINSLLELGNKKNVKVRFWNITKKYSVKKKNLCPWPFDRSYISSDNKIVPCCMIGNPDSFKIGEYNSLKDAWHSKEYQKFREGHINGNLPDVCKFCYENSDDEKNDI